MNKMKVHCLVRISWDKLIPTQQAHVDPHGNQHFGTMLAIWTWEMAELQEEKPIAFRFGPFAKTKKDLRFVLSEYMMIIHNDQYTKYSKF